MGQLSAFDTRDAIGSFRKAFEGEYAGSWAKALCQEVMTDKETETYRWLGGAPAPREWRGYRLYVPPGRYTMSIANVKYEASMRFDVDDIRRSAKCGNQIPAVLADMARKAAFHPEVLATTMIIDGDTTTSGLAYDGQQFFDTDHDESGSNQVNDCSVTQLPSADVTTTTKPTPAEWAAVLLEAIGWQYGYTDDQGDPCNVSGRQFGVMVGTAALYGGLVQAIKLNSLASGADNPLKALGEVSIVPIFNPRRSAATAEFDMFRLDGSVRPLIHQIEVPLETTVIGAGSETEFEEDAHKFGIKMVHGVGYGWWQHAMEVTFS